MKDIKDMTPIELKAYKDEHRFDEVEAVVGKEAADALRKLYDFYEKKPKNKKGNSFPSRHAYSSFVIATLFFSQCTPIAIMLLVFALGMCISRVLLGIHFIRDVMAGALIGVIAAIAGLFLI